MRAVASTTRQGVHGTYPIVGMFEYPRVLLPPAPYHIDFTPLTTCGAIIAIRSVSGVPSNASRYSSWSWSLALDEFLTESQDMGGGKKGNTYTIVHIGSNFPVGSYTGLPVPKLSFHSMAPKCSQTMAALAFCMIAGRSDIQEDSLRCLPDMWPVVITKLFFLQHPEERLRE
jgi:hypothetical protein